MILSYNLPFLIFVYLGSIAALLCFIVLALAIIVQFIINKKVPHKIIKFTALIILAGCLYLSLPWWFLTLAVQTKDPISTEKYYKMTINTAVFPSVKSYMYSNLGEYYYGTLKGKEALNSYEKALLVGDSEKCDVNNANWQSQCKDYIFSSKFHLCMIYTTKGDTEKAVNMCKAVGLTNRIAENHILTEDYNKALDIINKKIESDRKVTHRDYATRAYIYQKLGQNDNAAKDYDKALSVSKNEVARKTVENIKNDENYYKNFYKKQKSEYGFQD